jgi:molybdopterin molybdotransferase
MLDIDQALAHVLDHTPSPRAGVVELSACLHAVLAEAVASDIDSPPHDKAIVDGYAVVAASITSPGTRLEVIEEVTAGQVPQRAIQPGQATRIMTGAPIPAGADAVVMVEQTEAAGDAVVIQQAPLRPGQNIMRRAASMSRGQAILPAGTLLRPIEVGLLAEVGRHQVQVFERPRVAVLATGNELVESRLSPGPGQIRNSNGPMLAALAEAAGCTAINLGIATDDPGDLRRAIAAGLEYDLLLISGGVSAGVLDLVPRVLGDLGVEQVFHKVNLKPGKPLWFGRRAASGRSASLVFGLPGNPVSSLVGFELFVRPAVQKLRGLDPRGLAAAQARLARDHQQRGDRPTFWPARLDEHEHDAVHRVTPLAWQGSGDLRTLSAANCLAFFPAGDRLFITGELVTVRLLEPRCPGRVVP